LNRVEHIIRCPACGRLVRALAWGGEVKGWCAVQGKYVQTTVKKATDDATKRAGRRS